MNWLDIVLVLVLVVSVASSFSKGFTRELIGFAAAIVGLICGLWYYRVAGDVIRPYVGSTEMANLCGFLAIFLAAIVAGWMVSVVIGMMVKAVGLSWLDRLLGAAFGVARGILVGVAVITAIVAFAPGKDAKSPPESVVDSRLAPYIIDASHELTRAAPKQLRDEFDQRYQQIKRIWDEAMKKGLGRLPETEI